MQQFIFAAVYFLRDMLFALSLYFVVRYVLLLPCKKRIWPAAVFPLLMAGNAAGCAFLLERSPEDVRAVADVLSFLLGFLFALCLLRRPKRGFGAVFLCALLVDFTADTLYSLFASFGGDAPLYEAVFGLVLFALFGGAVWFAVKKGRVNMLPGAFRKLPKPLFAVLLFFEFTCYYREFGEAQTPYRIFYRVAAVAVVASLFWMMFRLLSFAGEERRLLQQLTVQKEYGERLQNDDEALRRFRHDYKNHMIVVNAYLERGDLAAAQAYVSAIQAQIAPSLNGIHTGNFAADAILNYKSAAAKEKGIDLRFAGVVPAAGVRDEDLCTVLSNLLDNAIEACEKLSGGDITVDCGTKNSFLLLSVENPAPTGSDPSQTSKKDRKNHGLGLKNVKQVLKNCNGHLTLTQENGRFIADARMELAAETQT